MLWSLLASGLAFSMLLWGVTRAQVAARLAAEEVSGPLVLRLLDQPLFLVCAARPDLYERRPHWGEGKTAHARLELEPLARTLSDVGEAVLGTATPMLIRTRLSVMPSACLRSSGTLKWVIAAGALASVSVPPRLTARLFPGRNVSPGSMSARIGSPALPGAMIKSRSMMLRSSRTLPGQS